MLDGDKLIITVALNGGMQQDRDGAIIPKQPVEIGEAAARCYEAGASLVHVHARDREGKNSGDKAIYAEIIREIRKRSPILIQTTNGIGVRRDKKTGQLHWPSDEERLGLLAIDPPQDVFGMTLGIAMGCDLVRVGFEDGIHLPDGSVARENAQMVRAAVDIAALFGAKPATVEEARKRFRIEG